MLTLYLHIIKGACAASLDVKGEEVESDHKALGLVNDPLTHFVVRIWVREHGSADLTVSRERSSTS